MIEPPHGRAAMRQLVRLVTTISFVLAAVPLFATEPARESAARTLAYHLGLTNGSELQVRIAFTASNERTTMRGIVHHVQDGRTCVFEERQDFRWWQSTLDFACGSNRIVLRVEFPSLADGGSKLASVPSMYKLMVGDQLHVWTVVGDKPQETTAGSLAQSEVRKLPRAFQRVLGELGKAMLSPEFIAEGAHAPAGFAMLGGLLEDKDLEVELTSIRPLTTTEAEQLVRLAAGTK